MKTILSLVLFLIIGIVGSSGFVSRTKIRPPLTGLFATGMEFFLVGMMLGPYVLGLITPEVVRDLKPIVYLALGWAGLLFGIELSWSEVRRVSKSVFRLLLLDGLLMILFFSLASFFFLRAVFPGSSATELIFCCLILAVSAAVSSPAIISIQAKRLRSRGRFTSTVKVTSSLGAVVPLLVFGLLYTIMHPGFFGTEGLGKGFLWWAFANATALILGFVMVLFTVHRCSENERLLLVIGTVILVGGFCYFLRFSSLYTAMIMGIVVGNFSRRREAIFRLLHQLEKTLFVAFLIIVGAMVNLTGAHMWFLLAIYILLHLVLRAYGSSWAVALNFPEFRSLGRRSGLVFTAQGAITLAMAIEYRMGTEGVLVDAAFTVIVFAVVINEVLAFALVQRSFKASGEIAIGKNQMQGINPR